MKEALKLWNSLPVHAVACDCPNHAKVDCYPITKGGKSTGLTMLMVSIEGLPLYGCSVPMRSAA